MIINYKMTEHFILRIGDYENNFTNSVINTDNKVWGYKVMYNNLHERMVTHGYVFYLSNNMNKNGRIVGYSKISNERETQENANEEHQWTNANMFGNTTWTRKWDVVDYIDLYDMNINTRQINEYDNSRISQSSLHRITSTNRPNLYNTLTELVNNVNN